MKDREQLIADLVSDLKPKPKQLSLLQLALIWWLLSWVYVVIATLLMGPLRPTAHEQLAHSHHFQIETLFGVVATLLVAIGAWYGAAPGALTKGFLRLGVLVSVVWVGFYVTSYLGLSPPAVEPSMLGKREYCYIEAFLYSVPPTAVACYFIAKRLPLRSLQTGLLIGLAAGMMPALFMQFACMYEPQHILTHHILPGIANGAVGLLLLPLMRLGLQRLQAQ